MNTCNLTPIVCSKWKYPFVIEGAWNTLTHNHNYNILRVCVCVIHSHLHTAKHIEMEYIQARTHTNNINQHCLKMYAYKQQTDTNIFWHINTRTTYNVHTRSHSFILCKKIIAPTTYQAHHLFMNIYIYSFEACLGARTRSRARNRTSIKSVLPPIVFSLIWCEKPCAVK